MENYNVEVERAVIGEILTFEELREKALLIEEDDFYFREHKRIVAAMRELAKNNNDYDFIAVAAKCGGDLRSEIQACIQIAISVGLFDEHFKILKEMASRRRLTDRFNRLTMDGEVTIPNIQKIIDDEQEKRLFDDVIKTNAKNIDDFLLSLNVNKGAIRTGFGQIDKTLGGIRKGTVFIVGARPSTGKTSFALNIAANQFKDEEKTVMFFSLEMSAEMIYERVIASTGSIEYERFSRNTLSDEDMVKTTELSLEIRDSERFIVIDDVYNIEQICNIISENKPSFVVIDFMQIISTVGKFENVRSRIDYISSMLKRTAKTTGCAILVLSQLSRAGKEAPTMSDLKESGGLEQDGDYIALLHRPYVLNKGDGSIKPEQTELLLDKNKFGRTGKIDLYFDLKYQRFSEILRI